MTPRSVARLSTSPSKGTAASADIPGTSASISEAFSPRVQSFELQTKEGDGWKTFYKGTTLGVNFQASFEPVTARFVRLNVLQASDGPTIWEFQLNAR